MGLRVIVGGTRGKVQQQQISEIPSWERLPANFRVPRIYRV